MLLYQSTLKPDEAVIRRMSQYQFKMGRQKKVIAAVR